MAWSYMIGVALTIIFLLNVISKTKNSWLFSNLPPGNFLWPILGENSSFASSPAKFIRDRMMKHSRDIFQTSFAGEKMVIICGASGNKFLYSNDELFKIWLPRCVTRALQLIDIESKSPSWVFYKKQLHEYVKVGSLQKIVGVMDTEAREHIEKNWVPYDEVKVKPLSKEYGFRLVCLLFLSYKEDAVVRNIIEPFYILAEQLLSVPINLPGTAYNRALKASRRVKGHLTDLIRRRRVELMSKANDVGIDIEIDGQDFLSRVILAWDEEFSDSSLDDDELAGHLIGLLFAGFHSTTVVITFALAHLAEYPDVYAKVLQGMSSNRGYGKCFFYQ